MRALHGYIKHLSGKHVAGADAAADHSGPCAVNAGVRPLRAAEAEFHDSVAAGRIAYPGRLGGDEALVVDNIQNSGFNQLRFHNRSDDFNHWFPGEHDASFRNCIDASGKFEILQIFKEVVLKNSQTFQIGNFIIIEMQVFHIFDNLRKPCADGVAGFHRVIPVKGVKNYRFITVHVLKVALHHRQFVKIGHEGKIPRFHGFSSAFSIMGSDTGRRMKGCPLPV